MGLGIPHHPDVKMRAADYEHLTPLYVEMKIAAEYLHCSHGDFLKLPKDERMKFILYEEMVNKREQYFRKKSETERKNKAANRNKNRQR